MEIFIKNGFKCDFRPKVFYFDRQLWGKAVNNIGPSLCLNRSSRTEDSDNDIPLLHKKMYELISGHLRID